MRSINTPATAMTSTLSGLPPLPNGPLHSNGSSISPCPLAESNLQLSQSMESINTAIDEEVRTLFVSGLPMDAKPRELYLLFRGYKGFETALLKIMGKIAGKMNNGYEGSLLKVTNKNGKNTSPVGFVTFISRVTAEAAKQDLQGVRFDTDLPQTLRLEFAKSNTKVQKPKQLSPQPAAPHPTFIHPLTGQEIGGAFMPGVPPPEAWAHHPLAAYPELSPPVLHHPHTALMPHPGLAQLPTIIPHMPVLPQGHHLATSPILGSPISAAGSPFTALIPPQQTATNSPCSTLFVANLGQFASEQELKDLFNSVSGCNRVRMHNKGGAPVAFVEYNEVRSAVEALNRLQGFVLMSSERGGIRIEFARNKMGEAGRKEEYPSGSSPANVPALSL